MKKLLIFTLAVLLIVPQIALVENADIVEINREAVMKDFAGEWVLVAAYTSDDGQLPVVEDAITLSLKLITEYNVLVDTANYRHADVDNLNGELTVNLEEADVDPYRCNSAWNMLGIGASRFKIRDDDEGLFFLEITGVEIDDMELMDVIALNKEGQLILGYSEDRITEDLDAVFEYAYIFDKVGDAE